MLVLIGTTNFVAVSL